MKTIIATVFIVAFVVAEPPPSNSYLPPPPSSRTAGYSSGPQSFQPSGPQVVAARSFEGGHGAHGGNGVHGNGFSRSSPEGNNAQARFGDAQGYDHNAAAFGRNALDDSNNSEPANYNFEYSVNDHHEGTDFGHHEERQEERAQGEYHVVLPDGRKQTVSYEADERGFKPQISYEDSEDLARSGYDANANNFRSNGGGYHGNDHNDDRSNHGNAQTNGY